MMILHFKVKNFHIDTVERDDITCYFITFFDDKNNEITMTLSGYQLTKLAEKVK